MTYRVWTSLEPDPRSSSPMRGARATLSDPAFMLGRQWQFGEFDGFDGGDAVFAEIKYQQSDFATSATPKGEPVAARPNVPPVASLLGEPMQRRLASDGPEFARLSLKLGRILLRRARMREAEPALRAAATAIPAWAEIDPGPLVRVAGMRGGKHPLDGVALVSAFSKSRESWPDHEALELDILALLVSLGLPVPAGEEEEDRPLTPGERLRQRLLERQRELRARDTTQGVLEHFRDAFDDLSGDFDTVFAEFLRAGDKMRLSPDARPGAGEAFDIDTLEHRLTLTYDEAMDFGGQLVQQSSRPAWWTFDRGSMIDQDTIETVQVTPTRLSFPGQPTDRFWQRHDTGADWQSVDAGTTDLPRMIAGVALSQAGPHTFVLPLTVARGGQVAVHQITLQDTFGERTSHRGAARGPQLWDSLRRSGPAQITDFLEADPLEGNEIRELALVPEEMSDRIWAIARKRTTDLGRGEAVFESIVPPQPPEDGQSPHYLLRQPPPSTWLPLVWDDTAAGYVPSPITSGPVHTELRTDISALKAGILPRTGLALRHVWKAGRDRSGRLVVWLARDLHAAQEMRASGLSFDRLVLPSDKT